MTDSSNAGGFKHEDIEQAKRLFQSDHPELVRLMMADDAVGFGRYILQHGLRSDQFIQYLLLMYEPEPVNNMEFAS